MIFFSVSMSHEISGIYLDSKIICCASESQIKLYILYFYLQKLATKYKHLYFLTNRLRAPAVFF